MNKAVLTVLMLVVIVTPCFSQELEPDGLFSIEGTEWMCIGLAFLISPPFIMPVVSTFSFTDPT